MTFKDKDPAFGRASEPGPTQNYMQRVFAVVSPRSGAKDSPVVDDKHFSVDPTCTRPSSGEILC